MKRLGKRGLILLVAGVVAVLGAVGGYAYWTAAGAGTTTPSTNATSNGALVLSGSFAPGLAPGGSAPISFTADNLNTTSLRVGTIHSVVGIDAAHVTAGCLASDFTVADVAANQTIPATTSGVALTATGSIAFADTASNQDGCKGAIITLTLSS